MVAATWPGYIDPFNQTVCCCILLCSITLSVVDDHVKLNNQAGISYNSNLVQLGIK